MNLTKTLVALACAVSLLAGSVSAAEKTATKLTCCQQAGEAGKDCTHKCCVAAHKEGKSCVKCNPGKEDLKLKKVEKKAAQKPAN